MSIGSVGSAEYQKESNIRTIEFSEFFTTTQPQPKLSAEDAINSSLDKHNYSGMITRGSNIWKAIVSAMEEYRNQPLEFTPLRTEQEEADRLVKLQFPISCYKECISMLQLRGLSTTFEEKVLTILKGM